MKITTRFFDRTDLSRLFAFLGAVRHSIQHTHYLHIGDILWQLFHMLAAYNSSQLIQIWQDDQDNWLGFVLVYPPFGVFDLQVHPDFRGQELESEMLGWALSQLNTLGKPSATYTLVNEHDTLRKILLEARHFNPMGDWWYMSRSLALPIPSPQLPPTFTLKDMTDSNYAARANALATAFGAPPQSELYQQFMRASGYDPQLDIVAIAPDGEVASFAMCWLDQVSQDGQFEPVGTTPQFQRLGLGKAVLLEGMNRMRQRGMQNAIVIVDAAEEPARQLYESVGMTIRWKIQLYGSQ